MYAHLTEERQMNNSRNGKMQKQARLHWRHYKIFCVNGKYGIQV